MELNLTTAKELTASLFVFGNHDNEPLVTIDRDGIVTIHNEEKVNEAAKIFWQAVQTLNPYRELAEENKRLKALLDQVNEASQLAIPTERTDLYNHYRWRDDHICEVTDSKGESILTLGLSGDRKHVVETHNAALRSLITTMAYEPGVPPKPFCKPGAWFPLDVMGNPMFEYAPGKWDVYRKAVPFEAVRINPDFWVQQIRTTMHTTDCPAKVQVLENCANHLERYLEVVKPFVKEAPHDSGSLCSPLG